MAMSYGKDTSVKIKESASLVPRNLAVLQGLEEGSLTYAVIRKHRATITATRAGSSKSESCETVSFSGSEKDSSSKALTNIQWCRLKSSRVVLVVTSYRGFKITSWDGSELLYKNLFESRKGSYDQRFARGITSVDNVVCVGNSEGNIMIIFIPPAGSEIVFCRQLQGHSAAITDLCTCGYNRVASSDESGMIIVWSNPVISAESTLVINEPGGFPCLSLCCWGSLLVAGFSNGQIRLYSVETGQKTVEIAAHGRCITALDVARDSGLLLSVSEDSTACIWTLPSETNPKVCQLFCVHIPDRLLCGGQFCDPHGDRFALSAFECATIFTFKRTSQS